MKKSKLNRADFSLDFLRETCDTICQDAINGGEKPVNAINLGNALAKSKDIALELLSSALSRTRVEPIGTTGVKAHWTGEPGANRVAVSGRAGNIDIELDGPHAPTVEYVEQGEKRIVAFKNLKDISCELDPGTLDKIATPKGAAIAACAGAAVGLFGWFLISVLRSVSTVATDADDAAAPAIASEAESTDEN